MLDAPPPTNNDSYPILQEEVEAAVKSLKKGKSAGVDNIPSKLVPAGGEAMADVLLIICSKIWQTGEWPTPWTQSLIITLPTKGNLQLYQNYRTISLISYPSKVMLRNTLRNTCNTSKAFTRSFVDFKKAFDRAWHATMRLYNINDNLIRIIECLNSKATSAVYHDNNIGELRQGCLLSPTLFNIFLERITADALEDHEGTVIIGSRTSTNFRFADDIDGPAGQEQERVKLVNHIEETCTAYGMQISAEKTQLMTNNTNGISTDITIDSKKLETVRSFKHLGAIVSDERSKPEVLSRIAQTTAAVTKLKVIWNDKNIDRHQLQGQTDAFPGHVHILYTCETR